MKQTDANAPAVDENFCAVVDAVAALIERKHTTVILGILLMEGAKGFNQLKRDIGCISANALTQRLNLLLEHALISKEFWRDGNVLRARYQLTPLGRDFFPVMCALRDWGDKIFAPAP